MSKLLLCIFMLIIYSCGNQKENSSGYHRKSRSSQVEKTRKNDLSETSISVDAFKIALLKGGEEGNQYGSLEKFRKWAKEHDWKQFRPTYHHYDWWMFPINKKSQFGSKYVASDSVVNKLKKDPVYMSNYREGIKLMILSWGWDLETDSPVKNPEKHQDWDGWDVRLKKLLDSVMHFKQNDLIPHIVLFVDYLKKDKKIKFDDDTEQMIQKFYQY